MVFSADVLKFIPFVPSYKIIAGCTFPLYLPKLLELLDQNKCRAGFVNSLSMFQQAGHRENLFCCQNGVDIHFFRPSPRNNREFTACWVGNSSSVGNKGLDLVKSACDETRTPLLFLDRNALQKEELLSQEKIRDEFYFLSSVYICASEFEATPNPALEALACGLPIISTRVGNMPEIIEDGYNGFLVERSATAIAGAIEKMKASDWETMSRNARLSIENGWSWEQQVKKYEHMFQCVLKSRLIDDPSLHTPIPMDAQACFSLGLNCKQRWDNDHALFWFNKALQTPSISPLLEAEIYFNLGSILEKQNPIEASSLFTRYIHIVESLENPSPQHLYRAASFYKQKGNFHESRRLFQRIIDIDLAGLTLDNKLKGGVFFHLGEIALNEGEPKAAGVYFKKCLEYIPDHKKAAGYIGV